MNKKTSMQKVILVKIDFIYNVTNIVENRYKLKNNLSYLSQTPLHHQLARFTNVGGQFLLR